MSILKAEKISVEYEGTAVLKDLSFRIEKGEFLAVVGENGSGKSTLIKAILGLVGLSSGSIRLDGGIKSGGIGYLPQQREVQKDFPAAVYEVVLSGCLASRRIVTFYSPDDKRLALRNMELLEIADLRKRSFRDLSGGQQQRVLLARALCSAKAMLILDEPTAGVSPIVMDELFDRIIEIARSGISILMVEQNARQALEIADKGFVLVQGRNRYTDTGAALLADPEVRKSFLGG